MCRIFKCETVDLSSNVDLEFNLSLKLTFLTFKDWPLCSVDANQ